MKIANLKLVNSAGALIARFDAVGQHLTIKGFGIFRRADGSSWISEPATKFTKRDGTTDYQKHVTITDPCVKEEIERQAKEALAELELGSDSPVDEEVPF